MGILTDTAAVDVECHGRSNEEKTGFCGFFLNAIKNALMELKIKVSEVYGHASSLEIRLLQWKKGPSCALFM